MSDDDEFEIVYEVDDGYVTGSRPQRFTVQRDWYTGDESDEELEQSYMEMIDDAMRERVSACYDEDQLDRFREWVRSNHA